MTWCIIICLLVNYNIPAVVHTGRKLGSRRKNLQLRLVLVFVVVFVFKNTKKVLKLAEWILLLQYVNNFLVKNICPINCSIWWYLQYAVELQTSCAVYLVLMLWPFRTGSERVMWDHVLGKVNCIYPCSVLAASRSLCSKHPTMKS